MTELKHELEIKENIILAMKPKLKETRVKKHKQKCLQRCRRWREENFLNQKEMKTFSLCRKQAFGWHTQKSLEWEENCSHKGVTEQINNHNENIRSEVSHNYSYTRRGG